MNPALFMRGFLGHGQVLNWKNMMSEFEGAGATKIAFKFN
jgi:hypothetical protein